MRGPLTKRQKLRNTVIPRRRLLSSLRYRKC